CDTVNRGASYADGTLVYGTLDGYVIALDAATGKEKWVVKHAYPEHGETITSAPLIAENLVIIGFGGDEFAARGRVTAYNLADGKAVWSCHSTGSDKDVCLTPDTNKANPHFGTAGTDIGVTSYPSTNGGEWKIGGGSTWGWYAWDPKLDLVYYGTANPSTWNPVQRAGPDGKPIDQKWTMSIIARNPGTGEAAWAYQMTPFDEWDYDGVNEMILVDDMDVKGKKHNVLVHFDRNGFGYTVDRESGLPLVAEKYDPAVNWSTGVDLDPKSPTYGRPAVVASKSTFLNGADVNTTDVCPAALGTKDQQPAAYSPLTKLFYVPTNHVCMDYE
ncbi:PQQ-binding-like beta-propeller repeat protein, partial [Microbacteriaceae bacterium K1510]|nr:PQQ-binding-like beta-propeller repeat protein [Microbacteriaceae bacterium K1510]